MTRHPRRERSPAISGVATRLAATIRGRSRVDSVTGSGTSVCGAVAAPGLRERTKQRTRQQIADTAPGPVHPRRVRRDIAPADRDDAEVVAVPPTSRQGSTLSPTTDARTGLVARAIADTAADEPPDRLLRRTSLALAERDAADPTAILPRLELRSREPLCRLRSRSAGRARRTFHRAARGVPERRPTPRSAPHLAVSAAMAAVTAAWSAPSSRQVVPDTTVGQAASPRSGSLDTTDQTSSLEAREKGPGV